MKNNLVIGGIIALVVSGLFWAIAPARVDKIVQNIGAIAGPDMPFQYISVGGLPMYAARVPMSVTSSALSSTTLCAVALPQATSTLVSAFWQISTGTSTGATAVIDMATSTSPYATTTAGTPISSTSLTAGTTGASVWSGSGLNVSNQAGSTSTTVYLIVKTENTSFANTGYVYTGTCGLEANVL